MKVKPVVKKLEIDKAKTGRRFSGPQALQTHRCNGLSILGGLESYVLHFDFENNQHKPDNADHLE